MTICTTSRKRLEMSRKLPLLTVATIVRGMTTAVEDDYVEFLACTEDEHFFFRIREEKHPEGNEYFVLGMVRRFEEPPAVWTDFPLWIKIE